MWSLAAGASRVPANKQAHGYPNSQHRCDQSHKTPFQLVADCENRRNISPVLLASFREQSRARKGAVQFRSDRGPMGWPTRPPLSTAPLRARLCSRKLARRRGFYFAECGMAVPHFRPHTVRQGTTLPRQRCEVRPRVPDGSIQPEGPGFREQLPRAVRRGTRWEFHHRSRERR